MRIALVIGNYSSTGGGAERWTDRHASHLLQTGHDVHLISRSFTKPPPRATLHRIERARGRLRFAAAAEELAKRVNFDVVHDMGDAHRIDVVYNGVDSETFRPADSPRLAARRDNIRRAWGWEDRVVFLLVAHNFRLKGLDALLRAMARLPRSGAKVGLAVAGNDRTNRYAELARTLGVADRVKFLGNHADAVPLFQAADVYVQPTFYDPCSLVVLEAMACGLPTITTAANGAGELLQHGRSGFILDDPADDATLAEFMRDALDADFRRIAGAEARRTAEGNTMAASSARYLALYQRPSVQRRAA
jgi:UDP-glucose:(heptosyl)LPS alpha-1,3-glucosyltransferase